MNLFYIAAPEKSRYFIPHEFQPLADISEIALTRKSASANVFSNPNETRTIPLSNVPKYL